MEWPDAIRAIAPYVVRIATPRGTGTGFVVSSDRANGLCAIATAAHVIDDAHYWEEPIRIEHYKSGKSIVVRAGSRATFLDEPADTAAILFDSESLSFPQKNIRLIPEKKHLREGHELGWIGFPGIADGALCFFSGRVSSWLKAQQAYLVDGVAVNGVSGGPAFHLLDDDWVVTGVLSAYIPNRLTGEVLPGLCEIRDVKQFQSLTKQFTNVEEAKEKETIQLRAPFRRDEPPVAPAG